MDLTFAIAVSAHLGLAGDYGVLHPHVRLEQGRVVAGAYLNSESRLSLYAALRAEDGPWWIEGGAVTGYLSAPVLPFVRAGRDFDGWSLFVAPGYEAHPRRFGVVLGVELQF
jgi:hypothetical protein